MQIQPITAVLKRFSTIGHLRLLISITVVVAIALIFYSLHSPTKAEPLSQIVISFPTYPRSFNPAFASYPSVIGYTHEGLVQENEKGEIIPALAESWQFSEDKQQITFTLREGLKWSDGQPITVDDVVFTYKDVFLNKTIPNEFQDLLKSGKNRSFPSVEKIDNSRVKFTLSEPFLPFLRIARLPILPIHALQGFVDKKDKQGQSQFLSAWGTNTPPQEIIANGPYTIERYIPGERVFLRKNPYYWRKDTQGNLQPYIERVIWQTIDSTDNAVVQFRSKGLDYLSIDPSYFSLLKREEKRGNFTIYNGGASLYVTHITFNLNQGSRNGKPLVNPIKSRWFNTLAFRQAISYSIDRQSLLNNVYAGLGEIPHTYIPPQSPYYISPEESFKTYEYNPEKAKELLLEAGFQYNSRGRLLDSQGNLVRFTLTTIASEKNLPKIAANIKQDLDKIGIQVDIQTVPIELFLDKVMNTSDWECHIFPLRHSVEPNDLASVFSPESTFYVYNRQSQKGQPPITGRKVADWERRIGDLYVRGAREFDEAKRKAIYAEAQRLNQEYLPYILLVKPLELAVARNHIQNVKYSAAGNGLWNIYELKMTQETDVLKDE